MSRALLKSAIAHLHFESVHHFEDGNGRTGRALAEFTLSPNFKRSCIAFFIKNDLTEQEALL
ncbi:Fic family protein [Pedobacter sp. CG_S7]|uniref:Fic family protein n=1 Tax=Pedobacter sp. CG_S7 TaxID=3143930 RepID=UPI00339275CB